ncbi:hypothetical protein HOY82DRAFT_169996 [Tuber indicum]|nr:hypothetical protein HOY82DRAFT_169996 [Tuber indicum]
MIFQKGCQFMAGRHECGGAHTKAYEYGTVPQRENLSTIPAKLGPSLQNTIQVFFMPAKAQRFVSQFLVVPNKVIKIESLFSITLFSTTGNCGVKHCAFAGIEKLGWYFEGRVRVSLVSYSNRFSRITTQRTRAVEPKSGTWGGNYRAKSPDSSRPRECGLEKEKLCEIMGERGGLTPAMLVKLWGRNTVLSFPKNERDDCAFSLATSGR